MLKTLGDDQAELFYSERQVILVESCWFERSHPDGEPWLAQYYFIGAVWKDHELLICLVGANLDSASDDDFRFLSFTLVLR